MPVNPNEVVTPLTRSKSFASNLLAGVLLPLIWPFIPDHIKQADWLPAFIGAFYILSNAIFRELTKTRAKDFVQRLIDDFDLPSVDTPSCTREHIDKL